MSDPGKRARHLHQVRDPWDAREVAVRVIRETLEKTDQDRARNGMPLLAHCPMSREERANALKFILSGPQDAASVAAAGAQCVAFLEAILRAEDGDPFTGDAA